MDCFQDNIKVLDFSKSSNWLIDTLIMATTNTVVTVCFMKKCSREQAKLIHDPWMTKEIMKQRKIRDNLKKIYILNKCSGSDDHNNQKKQRNNVNRMIETAKNEYSAKKCEEAKGSK